MTLSISTGRTRVAVVLLLVGVLLTGTLFPLGTETRGANGGSAAGTLQSLSVIDPPVVDGLPDDEVWEEAIELEIEVKGRFDAEVKLRSVYTDTDLYIYAEWEDPTMSITRATGAWEYNPIPDNTVRSGRTTTPPVIDGDGTDRVWETALPLKVNLEFGTNPGEVTIRSLYTDTDVYFKVTWNDPTFSIPRSSWVLDTGTGEWSMHDGLEDMVNLMWDMDTTGFETVGCQAKCHIGKDWSYLDVPGDIADIWHVMAGRSLSATEVHQLADPTVADYEATSGEFQLLGYGDDTKVEYDPDEGQFPTGGRHGDDGTASFSPNANESGGSPSYIEKDPADWLDAMVLHMSEVDAGETVTADPEDPSYSASDVADAWANYDALGASVPESVLAEPTGSRGDIDGGATWKDGVWTVEMGRPLVTDNGDDVQFDDLDATYDFGISTMNNTAGKGHNYVTRPLHMDFQPDFLNPGIGSEDRMAILWEITPIEGYESAGCFVKCHPEYGRAGAFLENPGEKGDMWNMRAARFLPVESAVQSGLPEIDEDHQATEGRFSFHGYLDDMQLNYDEPPHVGDGGLFGDNGLSSFTANRNPDGTKPLYIEVAPEDYLDAMVLQRSEIDGGETLEVASADAMELRNAALAYELVEAIIPENIVDTPEGSRGDVEQAAVWNDGVWTTEMRRALVTDNEDDVQFDDLVKTYRFSIAVMDNSAGDKHGTPGTDTYLLSLYVPPTSYEVTVGPIVDSSGNPVEGANVELWRNATSFLNGTTNASGNFTITVPPNWADSTVDVIVSKEGFQNATFVGVIDDQGGFFPMAGTTPTFLRKGEGEEEDTPGMAMTLTVMALLGAALFAARTRRGGGRT
ncbi:MAG: carboxypeptidase regulatory-like domain-containing protein [Thermoplasmata archaeon]|nr:MAG: carboxypeptidase regulatory-like domain-containing protein [Thermoplasmata archaeon]